MVWGTEGIRKMDQRSAKKTGVPRSDRTNPSKILESTGQSRFQEGFLGIMGCLGKPDCVYNGSIWCHNSARIESLAARDFHRQILEHLRDFRNKAVHAGETNAEMEVLLYQLRRYVEQLIFFHLNNRFHFASFKEVTALMAHRLTTICYGVKLGCSKKC